MSNFIIVKCYFQQPRPPTALKSTQQKYSPVFFIHFFKCNWGFWRNYLWASISEINYTAFPLDYNYQQFCNDIPMFFFQCGSTYTVMPRDFTIYQSHKEQRWPVPLPLMLRWEKRVPLCHPSQHHLNCSPLNCLTGAQLIFQKVFLLTNATY